MHRGEHWTSGPHRPAQQGDRVRRGPQWVAADEDGGAGKEGFIIGQNPNGSWKVRWPHNRDKELDLWYREGAYRFEIDEAYQPIARARSPISPEAASSSRVEEYVAPSRQEVELEQRERSLAARMSEIAKKEAMLAEIEQRLQSQKAEAEKQWRNKMVEAEQQLKTKMAELTSKEKRLNAEADAKSQSLEKKVHDLQFALHFMEFCILEHENALDGFQTEIMFAAHAPSLDKRHAAIEASELLDDYKRMLYMHRKSSLQRLRHIYTVSTVYPSVDGDSEPLPSSNFFAWGNFAPVREIGAGGFGTVHCCRLLGDFSQSFQPSQQPLVAVKAPSYMDRRSFMSSSSSSSSSALSMEPTPMRYMSDRESDVRKSIENEISVLRKLTSPNVVRYLGTTTDPSPLQALCIVQQFCAGGDLSRFMKPYPKGVEEKTAFQFALQIAGGLRAIHKLGVVHRDLKPENILLVQFDGSDMPIVKLSDFGSVSLRSLNDELSHLTGGCAAGGNGAPAAAAVDAFSFRYVAPELVVLETRDSFQDSYLQDLWSFGLILYRLRTGRLPFDRDNVLTFGTSIASGRFGQWPQEEEVQQQHADSPWQWLRIIADQCLTVSPAGRLAHFTRLGAKDDSGRDAFKYIVKQLRALKPEWAKEVKTSMMRFERKEIRDPFLTGQVHA